MPGHVKHIEKESENQNPGVCIPACMLASLRNTDIAPCFLSFSLWILYFFLLSGTAFIRRWKISQPEESTTGCGMAAPSKVGALLLDLLRMISNAQQNSCVKDGHRHHPATLPKGSKYTIWKKSQNCHIFDSRVTKLFRSFLPHGNLCKIHFVDEALCVLCGRACIGYLDIDLYSACHLRLTGKAKAAINVLPLPHSPLSYMYAGDHISCHITQWRWGSALMLYVSYIYYTHTCSA